MAAASLLPIALAQFVPMEMRCYPVAEIEPGYDRQDGSEEIGHLEGSEFGDVAAQKHTGSDAYVPGSEVGTGGGSSLAVGSQVDEQGVEGRKHGAESDAEQQGDGKEEIGGGCQIPSGEPAAGTQSKEAEADQVEPGLNYLGDHSPVDQPPREEARHGHADGHAGEEEAGRGGDADLFGIHGHVVGGHSVGDRQEQEAESSRQTFQQNEAVEREGFVLDGRSVGGFDQRGTEKAECAGNQGTAENPHVVDACVVQEKASHRSHRHGHVVGQSVVAQSFSAARRGHDVDDNGIAAYGDHAERQTVEDAEQDEQGKGAGHYVASEDGRKDEVGHQVKGFAGKRIEQEAREGADAQGGQGVTGEYGPNGGFIGVEYFSQVEGQYGHQQPESEKQQEIGCQDL